MPQSDIIPVSPSARRRWAASVLRVAAACYLGLLAVVWLACDMIIFPVPPPEYRDDSPYLVRIPLPDGGTLPALWLPNPGASWTVLYCHANAEDLGSCRAAALEWRARGYAVLAVEYPGYGRAGGAPSEEGCYLAALAGYLYLRRAQDVPASRLAVYGRSLGGAVAVDLAAREPVGALLLESTFLSAFRVRTGVRLFPIDRFDSYAKISRVRCPLLVIHGEADELVPFRHGRVLFESAAQAPLKRLVPIQGAGHNDVRTRAGAAYGEAIDSFLDAAGR